MSKPQFDLTGINTQLALRKELLKRVGDLGINEKMKFGKYMWTCKTFDEWLSLGENWFEFVGVKMVADGENHCTTDNH